MMKPIENGDTSALAPLADRATDTTIAPVPLYSAAQMADAVSAYKALQQALDRAMPDQIITLDGRPFRRKGFWRAVAVAFGLEVEVVYESREVRGTFLD